MLLGLVLMLSVLILLFGSVIQPFTILFSLAPVHRRGWLWR